MKVKEKYSFVCILICFSLLFLTNCSEEKDESAFNDIQLKETEVISFNKEANARLVHSYGDIKLIYQSSINAGKVTSNLDVFDNAKDKLLVTNTVTVNKVIPNYKLGVHYDIEKTARKLKDKLSQEQWQEVLLAHESFIKTIINKIDPDKYRSDLIQSLYFHLAVLNTIDRSFKENVDCECTPHPGYFIDKTTFWCQEDYFLNVNLLNKHLRENKDFVVNLGGNDLINYIQSLKDKREVVSFKEIYFLNRSEAEFKTLIAKKYKSDIVSSEKVKMGDALVLESDCLMGKGTDLGCCGNYSGCCWLATYECWLHDVECWNCDKWHCGPACKSGV
ncbi:hypothetical protein H8S95_03625 [Pontibacter sp. KCTC 32443]|uniref:hypothetical protein n=1 Tax=Pontibacter TaxID=323449 RepID=UPI00164D26D4|nr:MULTISPECIES: hypothetical protein [Pontibacter]MBC5773142.1 hypothetical protein [Pontibacter sp. KCTC 32443]